MGLTIHYEISAKTRSEAKAGGLVMRMRHLALDLPFASVGDVAFLGASDFARGPDAWRGDDSWLKIQAGRNVRLPWSPYRYGKSITVYPEAMAAFSIDVGDGCEQMNVGLCRYPAKAEAEYRAEDDRRFYRLDARGNPAFDHGRFGLWRDNNAGLPETRTFRTGLSGWQWSSFCKTQYASDPACGGLANFLRCHVSAITLLERVGEVDGLVVAINDEGCYGPANYSDDHQEAYAAGREPTYVDHPATHSVAALARQVGESNERVAAFFGGLKDTFGDVGESPISAYPDFERLEFRGSQDPAIAAFLGLLKSTASAE